MKRILASKHFRSSPRLVELFSYIADACLRDAPEDATEQQIGQNVFGRKAGYNCSEDSIVRSEIRQLRLKLNLYFADEGAAESLIIEIPKGRYLLEFRPRLSPQAQELVLETDSGPEIRNTGPALQTPHGSSTSTAKKWKLVPARWTWFAAALILLGLTAAVLVFQRPSGDSSSTDALWEPFLSGNEPVVVYSNAQLRVTSQGGIQESLDTQTGHGATDSPSDLSDDSYTGVGEVGAVHALDRVFAHRGREFLLRRSHLLSWEEARENNLIVVGSTAQNKALTSLPTTEDFNFGNLKAENGSVHWGIINHKMMPNEKPFYTADGHAPPIEDYAIIALLQGPTEKHWILLLGGLGTYGTQAAAEFAMSEKGATRLLQLLGTGKRPHPFEAILRVDLVGEVPLNPEIVAFHER